MIVVDPAPSRVSDGHIELFVPPHLTGHCSELRPVPTEGCGQTSLTVQLIGDLVEFWADVCKHVNVAAVRKST